MISQSTLSSSLSASGRTHFRPSARRQRRSRGRTTGVAFRMAAVAVAGLLTAGVGACNSHDLQNPTPQPQAQIGRQTPVNPIRNLDIVFMIDNSPSTKDKQDLFRKNFPVLIEQLRKIEGGLPDLHIGIISSDVGAGGFLIPGNTACNRPGGDKGNFKVVKQACGLNSGERYIVSEKNGTSNNFTGSLESVFSCLAELGTDGCGFEHQLQAVRLSTSDVNPDATSFFRVLQGKEAYTAFILLTDEDDCSAPPDSELFTDTTDFDFQKVNPNGLCALVGHECGGNPIPQDKFTAPLTSCGAKAQPPQPNTKALYDVQEFVDYFSKKSPFASQFPERIVVAALAGWPSSDRVDGTPYLFDAFRMGGAAGSLLLDVDAVCQNGAGGKGYPGLRIKKFVEAFKYGSFDSVCADDYSPALEKIGKLLQRVIGTDCLPNIVDGNPDKDGIQPDCSVLDRLPDGSGKAVETPIPSCEANGNVKPCWSLVKDAKNCVAPENPYVMQVTRDGEAAPGTDLVVKCQKCVTGNRAGGLGCPCTDDSQCQNLNCFPKPMQGSDPPPSRTCQP